MGLRIVLRETVRATLGLLRRPVRRTEAIVLTPRMPTDDDLDAFLLDDQTDVEITNTPGGVVVPRWMYPAHCHEKRYSLALIAGEGLKPKGRISIGRDTRLFIRYTAALKQISSDGLACELFFEVGAPAHRLKVGELPIAGSGGYDDWRTAVLDLSWLYGSEGRLIVRCSPGADGDPTGDWLAIADLCVASEDRLALVLARSFRNMRINNEIEHFSTTYRHAMYAQVQEEQARSVGGELRPIRKLAVIQPSEPAPGTSWLPKEIEPLVGESAYGYASRLLGHALRETAPDYSARLRQMAQAGRVKVLSLCSGAARIEAGLAAAAPQVVEWSLLDINRDLLQLAALQFPPSTQLDLIEADANVLSYSGEKWDIILCVSALHHIVELERVIEFISHSLVDDGEFWSIGEYVGRDGNRLWPEAKRAADEIFQALPEAYRLNAHSKQVDTMVPDIDYSVGCFEGIRSSDIERLLDARFKPVDVYRRNCFLWRLVNLAYSQNYDVSRPEDRRLIADMVKAEVEHFRNGGRGTELFGVYKPRRA